jgi:hypothetical protein
MRGNSVTPPDMSPGEGRSQRRPARVAARARGAHEAPPAGLARAWRKAGTWVVVGCAALLATGCAALLAAGCAAGGGSASAGPASAAPAKSSHAAVAAQALSPAQRRAAARSYLAIARPANRRLDTDFDGLEDAGHDDLAAAQADLRDAAATERRFDRRLLALRLPAPTEAVARLLVAANQARIRLAVAAATSTSLSQLRRYEPRLTAANAPVEQAARVIRSQLDLPPPETS